MPRDVCAPGRVRTPVRLRPRELLREQEGEVRRPLFQDDEDLVPLESGGHAREVVDRQVAPAELLAGAVVPAGVADRRTLPRAKLRGAQTETAWNGPGRIHPFLQHA